MDIKTLVIGQKVSMTKSRVYGEWGEVVEVSPSGATVKTEHGELLRFDKHGKQTDLGQNEIWCRAGYPEFQPWELDKTYRERRRA